MRLAPGDRFDRYVIASLLGKGGMGEVYRAQDTRLQRPVALKILRLEEAPPGDPGKPVTDGAARILREARAVAAMDHPNAVAIFDVGEHEGVPFLAMELVAGKTLREIVGDSTASLQRRVRWLVDVARALGAAHRRGLVHRDVKPENVMIREDGVVKVLDFGIARTVGAPFDPKGATLGSTLETLSENGAVVGTPRYMAPEQLRGERIDGRADQFSWGVVAYELLTGSTPWDAGASSVQLLSQILSMDPPSLRAADPLIPRDVDGAILRALAKSPALRFSTIEEAAALLEPYAGASIELPAPGLGEKPRALPSLSSTKTQLATSPEGPVPSKTPRPAFVAIGVGVLAVALGVAVVRRRDVPAAASPADAAAATSASSLGLAWTDTGSQPSPKIEAQSAFTAGLQAVRDASVRRARALFERATTIDPSFSAAHLRAALLSDAADVALRTHFQRAAQLRLTLSSHDRALLDAIEPWTRVPTDLAESQRRLEALVAKEHDADSWFALALMRDQARDYAGAIAASDETLKGDPGFAAAHRSKARAELRGGDAAAAAKEYDECLRSSSAAAWCIEDQLQISARGGRCEAMERLARQLIAVDPESPGGYLRLAAALAARGQPLEAVRMALEQASQRTEATRREGARLQGETALDLLAGDLRAAADHAAQWERIDESPDDAEHAALAHLRMRLALEEGDASQAAKVAGEYAKRRAAWTADDSEEDPSLFVMGSAYRAKAITRDVMESERSSWLARDVQRATRVGQAGGAGARPWILAYAQMAVTPDDAKEALEALPRYLPLPAAPLRDDETDDAIGEAYLLAGDPSAARPYLEEAVGSCAVLDEPIAHDRAWLHLGIARAALGDVERACAAFARAASTWAASKGRSVTAEEARARARDAKCGG